MKDIINDIIHSFNVLWKVKERGNTIEIVTPIATTNNMFISIFLTKQGEEYVVTDGGWIDCGIYECEIALDDEFYFKLFQYYINDYEIQSKAAKGTVFYYKKTNNPLLVPNLVYDLSNFANAVISASFIQFQANKERESMVRFKKQANDFLKTLVNEKDLKTNSSIDETLSNVRFSAVITKNSRLTLINYVTGSNDTNFISSLGRANLNFDFVEENIINKYVIHKITLIDDSISSYTSSKVAPFIGVMNAKKSRVCLPWKEKEKIKEYINYSN